MFMTSKHITKKELTDELIYIRQQLADLGVEEAERKRLEKILQASEVRYRRLFETAQDGILIIDADTGDIVDVNPFLVDLLGYSHKEFIGKKLWEIGAFKDIEESRAAFKELQNKEYIRYENLPLETKEGRQIDVEFVSNAYRVNHSNVIQCNIRDITERKMAEEALKESEERYRNLFRENLSVMLLIDPQSGDIVDANPAACSFYGYNRKELTSMKITDINILDHETIFQKLQQAKLKQCGFFDFRHRLANGETRIVDVYSGPLILDGNTILHSIIHDVTDRKQMEEALKERTLQLELANQELESFSYSVSHDLRAPLRAIDGYTRMIINKYGDQFNEDALAKFGVIRNSAHMMAQLIDDLLTLSRLSRKDMFMSKIDMETLIRDAWKELHADNMDRNINLKVNSMPSGYGDRALIKQVYLNLLSNAIKFTKNQNPALIEVSGHIDGNKDVYYVKDNGAGFDMQYYNKLFGAFQRLHSGEDFEGTGIGLATVQRIINRHEGLVWAEGKVGEGATFYFSLPHHTHTQDESANKP
jgi:PAS domain S-box-containing protein